MSATGLQTKDVVKRVLLGRQVSSSKLEQTLLPKTLALPVFSSDPLSSVAYATEEMMLVLALAGSAAFSLMLPIAGLIAVVLAIVITSYRQTVRAYPRGGGSYIVAKENLGTVPGLVAAAAILQDYVLTVAVSVTAGTVAIVSAAPGLAQHRVAIALVLILLISLANLRGVREAGTLFALPTYGFVLCVLVTLVAGFARCIGGCPVAESAALPLEAAQGLTLFVILKAFSSGSTALTGVEAIADGVQAFRRPQSRNAATTLAVMGVMSISMFLGITFLARALQVRVSEHLAGTKSVLAQIGETVFGGGAMFVVLQVFTALILILAANTAYQDFPRLSAILARDGFVPRQFQNRGDRLVFSNGIVVLASLAMLLVWIFDADLTRLIQLYVVGVFTAFTLSQAGMVRRWVRFRQPGWRRSAAINAVGATATGVVLVIVAITKFTGGAWIVITAMPILVLAFSLVKRHYTDVQAALATGSVRYGDAGSNIAVLIIKDLEVAAAEAVGYLLGVRPTELHVLYVGGPPSQEVLARWERMAPGAPAPTPVGRRVDDIVERIRAIPRGPDDFVTVVIPELFRRRSLLGAVLTPVTFRLKVRLLGEPQVVVTDVPVLQRGHGPTEANGRPLIPDRVEAVVFVASVHDATIRAVNYATTLNAHDTRAVLLATEPEEAPALFDAWADRDIGVMVEAVEAPFRDLGPPLLAEVRRITSQLGTVAAVVLPEFVVTKWWHRLLHNNRALYIKRMLLFEPRVILSSVPYALTRRSSAANGTASTNGRRARPSSGSRPPSSPGTAAPATR